MLNIVQLVPRFDNYGGREEYVYNLAEALSRMGCNVKVLTSQGNVRTSSRFTVCTLQALPLLISRTTRWEYRIMPALPFTLMTMNTDIIHVHDIRHFTDIASITSKCKKIPLVITIHYGFHAPTRTTNVVLKVYDYTLGRIFLKMAKRIIFVSRGLMSEYKHRFPDLIPKMVVIPNAINVAEYQNLHYDTNDLKRRLELDRFKVILTGGRIVKRKGFQYLIQALRILVKEESNIKVVITGPDVGYKEALIHLIEKLGLKKYVFFTGMVSKETLKKLMAIADIFVLPSIYEGLPTILLEAMACEKPIVASDILGVREVVSNEDAILVKPGDVKGLAEAIRTLLQNKSLAKKLGQNARKKSLRYDWNTVAATILRVYKECLEE